MIRRVNKIHIHCSASKFGSAMMIDEWHKERGWLGIGYHFVICNGQMRSDIYNDFMNGSIEVGRDINMVPASISGHNDGAIAICLIGDQKFTNSQFISLVSLVKELMIKYNIKIKDVVGHYELYNGKTCPNFNMESFRFYLEGDDIELPEFI